MQKKRILIQFLKEISIDPHLDIAEEKLSHYGKLDETFDFLEINAVGVLDFAAIEGNPKQWALLRDIILSNSKFAPGNPPAIQGVSQDGLLERVAFWQRDESLVALPQNDFYNRNTQSKENQDLTQLVIASRLKMQPLIASFLKKDVLFDPANKDQVQEKIEQWTQKLGSSVKGCEQYALTEKQLAILEDLNKINQLTVISIPGEPDDSTDYCNLAESTGGVTEKVFLITLAKVQTQLTNLTTREFDSLGDYAATRSNYKLSTEAILKLPKHGDIKEVQRESMALNISRLLGLDTTQSSIMTHNGQPALFVPFDNIKLLKDYARGKTFKAIGFSGQSYEHYSTINSVGQGLQRNVFIDDFGPSLGLFYLCSDTDAVGGYNQNKALRNDRSLFIFNQVILSKDKLGLDSRISMQPIEFLIKHSRRGQGRNWTLIEDSSLENKFASIMALKEKQTILLQYASRIIHFHQLRIKELEQKLAQDLSDPVRKKTVAELKNLLILRNDADLLRTTIEQRIAKIDSIFPKHDKSVTNTEVRQALVLEKLLHNPALFSAEGRPYRNPWTQRQNNPVTNITDLKDGQLAITFDSKINEDMIGFIKRHGGGDSLLKGSAKEIVISRNDLNRLHETMLHPEFQLHLDSHEDYLDNRDLKSISNAYGDGHQRSIIELIDCYKTAINKKGATPQRQFEAIVKTEKALVYGLNSANDPGFGLHVLKKFYLDVQQKIQLMIPLEDKPPQLDAAFAAALKLDRIAAFNMVIKTAILNDKLSSPAFTDYLNACIQMATLASNHREAVQRSAELVESGRETIRILSQTTLRIEMALQESQSKAATPKKTPHQIIEEEDELADIRPIQVRKEELQQQLSRVSELTTSSHIIEEEQEKITDIKEHRVIGCNN